MTKRRSTALLTVRAVYEEAYRLDRELKSLWEQRFTFGSRNNRTYHTTVAAIKGNELAQDALIHYGTVNGVPRLLLPGTRTWSDRRSIVQLARDSHRERVSFEDTIVHDFFPDPANDARSLNARITERQPGYFAYLQIRKLLKQEVV